MNESILRNDIEKGNRKEKMMEILWKYYKKKWFGLWRKKFNSVMVSVFNKWVILCPEMDKTLEYI